MIQTVIKRDGRVVGYNEEKIKAAIRKAMITTEKRRGRIAYPENHRPHRHERQRANERRGNSGQR